MELKRVVVTGLGALTPIGNNIEEYWDGLVNGKSGSAPITYFDTEKFKTKFACEVKNFNAEDFFDRNLRVGFAFVQRLHAHHGEGRYSRA